MKITVHRGIDQIGGCITEIATAATRILIDLGQNLPDGEGEVRDELATREAVKALTDGVNAILYTHYHGDHIGLFHLVPDGVPQYIGAVAARVAVRKHEQLSYLPERHDAETAAVGKLKAMHPLVAGKSLTVGDIAITPYFVSHSACDAYMFLIEAEGKRILHTGDFRGHGYLSKGTLKVIRHLILPCGKVDFLITEGTMLSRPGEQVLSEQQVRGRISEVMRRHKYVFAMCSSTDMERLASFAAANRKLRGRLLVCDKLQHDILQIFSETNGGYSSLFQFGKAYTYDPGNQELNDLMAERGFCMLVRASQSNKFVSYLDHLLPRLDPAQTVLVYSMWKEYVNPQGRHAKQLYLDFLARFPNVEKIHTSGHATPEYLAEVCEAVNPATGIIPIHSERSAAFRELPIREELKARIIIRTQTVDGASIEIK